MRLCDVCPDGRSRCNVSAQPVPLIPGEIEEVTVDGWCLSQIFNTGHRVRVTTTSRNGFVEGLPAITTGAPVPITLPGLLPLTRIPSPAR